MNSKTFVRVGFLKRVRMKEMFLDIVRDVCDVKEIGFRMELE